MKDIEKYYGKLGQGIPIKEIASLIEAEVIGPDTALIKNLCPLDEPKACGLSFSNSLKESDWAKSCNNDGIIALIVSSKAEISSAPTAFTILKVKNPLIAISKLSKGLLILPLPEPGISPKADVHPSARIASDAHVGAFCSIAAGAVIKSKVVLHPHVVVYAQAEIGERTIVHAGAVIRERSIVGPDNVIQCGAVIGADGFGYFPGEKGLEPVPQVGQVVLESFVDVGANTCIDRATLGTTQIGARTKIDNLVQIGHNVKVGNDSILCGQVGIAGSSKIGKRVTLGGQVGVADHLSVSDGTRVGAQAGVVTDLPEQGDYHGHPAVKASVWRRQMVSLRNLPELLRKLRHKNSDGKATEKGEADE